MEYAINMRLTEEEYEILMQTNIFLYCEYCDNIQELYTSKECFNCGRDMDVLN